MLENVSWAELTILALVLLVFFGGKKVPEFIKGMGQAVSEFKKAAKDK